MSTVFSRNKEKRPRSSTNESNNSFVKNVTSRVSGFLPATITKWFSSPSSSKTNGSTPAADVTDSSSDDEVPESPVSSQPPAKRMRFSTPSKLNSFSSTDGNVIAAPVESKETPTLPYNTVQSPPGRNTFRRETNYVSTPIRSNEETVIEKRAETDKDTLLFKTQHTVVSIGQSVAPKRKSLFEALSASDSSKAKPMNTTLDPRYPNFKPALLGSPFYHGRTMYGGAASSYINQPNIKHRKIACVNESDTNETATMSHSARRIMDLLENYSSPLTEAKRIPKYVKPPRDMTLSVNTETSQRKNYSHKTQELHVPAIASILRLKQKSRLMDTTSAARQLIASYSSASEFNPYPSSTNNTQKENNSNEKNSNLTTKVKSRVTRQPRGDNVNEAPPPPVQLPNAVLQIEILPKFTLDNSLAVPAFTASSEVATSVTPTFTPSKTTAATATISSVFSIPYYITVSATSINSSSVKETGLSVDDAKDWKCSECWVPNKSNVDKCACCGNKRETTPTETPAKCTVCKLANSQCHVNKCVNCENLQSKIADSNIIKPVKTSQWTCNECWVSNDEQAKKCVCCGADNPATTNSKGKEHIWKCFICWIANDNNVENCTSCGTNRNFASFHKSSKCSICKLADSQPNKNKCLNCEKMHPITSDANKLTEKSQWKCPECWIGNDANVDKCVCCGTSNPKKLSSSTIKEKSSTSTINVDNGDWKCEDCWITNNSNMDKCDTCGGPKPGASKHNKRDSRTPFSSKSSDKGFKKIHALQVASKWECSSCLVRNDDDKTLCICCGLDRDYKTANVGIKQFNFGQNTNNTFKFGINPNFQNTNTSTMEHTSVGDELPLDECETNNNVLDKTPTFTFTLPSKKSEDKVTATKENVIETPKINFSFGVQKTTDFSSGNKVMEPIKAIEDKQSIQEVPKLDVVSSVKPLPALFTKPTASMDTPSPVVLELLGSKKSDIANSGSLISVAATVGSQISQSENKFTFSAGGLKSNINTFNVPASANGTVAAASTPSLFASPLQSAATATTASSIVMFQKPETNTTSTVTMFTNKDTAASATRSLFQNIESTTSAGTTPIAASSPFFSFGSKTQTTTQASVEKPKLSFTFGSGNKPEASTVFKSSFGSLSESGTNTTKFALPTGNMLSGGNGLSSNPITGPNGLSAVTSLTGNISASGNMLGAASDMTANPMSGGNSLQSTNTMPGSIFGAPIMKENMWPSNNNSNSNNNNTNNNNAPTNIFVSNANSNLLQKPATFTFGSTSPFNANNNATPAFGSPQPAQNLFGMGNQNSAAQPTLFGNPGPSQTAPTVFGTPASANPGPSMGMFGTPNVSATPSFGALNPQIPTFETPSMAPTQPAPFSFGSPQPSPVFGFGQQQQQQQQQQQPQQAQPGGVYSFGGAGGGAPQVQFNMGSAPNTMQRRVRKAVRRNPQR